MYVSGSRIYMRVGERGRRGEEEEEGRRE